MANLFDEDNAPEGEPTSLVVGDFVQWKRTALAETYPPATHSATYVLRLTAGGASEITINATERATYYLFSAASATTEAWAAGLYHWQLEVVETASGNRIVVDTGHITISPDLDANGADPRSHAQIMVAKIESLLAGRADKDVASYSIAGRSIAKMSIDDLLRWRDYYRAEMAKEERAANVAAGRGNSAKIKVRFV